MALLRWGFHDDPTRQLDRMRREMESLFDALRPGAGSSPWRGYRTAVYPPVNIYDDGESFIVRAEVPGVTSDDLDIEVAGDTLTLRGKRIAPEAEGNATFHRREREFGEFRRALTLPERFDGSKVVATFQDGILEVRLPHAEEAKARKVSVKAR